MKVNIIIILCFTLTHQQNVPVLPLAVPLVIHSSCPTERDFQAMLNMTVEHIRHLCGGLEWKRVAFLNMSNPNERCPSNWVFHNDPVIGCGKRSTRSNGCDSVTFSLSQTYYSAVCGRILAYQMGTTDAFRPSILAGQNTIESSYIDGVSLTYGPAGSRQHIWSFVTALYEDNPNYVPEWNCACTNTKHTWPFQVPTFVGNDYFCDTGNSGPRGPGQAFYPDNPLWDGKGCGPSNSCCQFNSPPWFYKTLPQTTHEDIEIRICLDDGIPDQEDSIIELIEIYVK